MERSVQPEWLDSLPPQSAEAQGSRRDLKRLNSIMGNASFIAGTMKSLIDDKSPLTLVELGAGDGNFALALASRLHSHFPSSKMILVDQHPLQSEAVVQKFSSLGWSTQFDQADVLLWLESNTIADVIFTNLFLHHFESQRLKCLLDLISKRCRIFIACEPRRNSFARSMAKLLPLIGCNRTTWHDGVISVKAGFQGNDLTQLWPVGSDWVTKEKRAGLFSHIFAAEKCVRSR